MINKVKMLSLSVLTVFMIQACHDDDYVPTADSPTQFLALSPTVYERLRTPPVFADPNAPTAAESEAAATVAGINELFTLAATVAGRTDANGDVVDAVGTEPCQVKLNKMAYDTVGGAGEVTTSTGVVMIPFSDDPASECNAPRPVVLYAHGTTADRNYDLSKLIADPNNPANGEGMLMLALYASEGYVVVAPNYAGYADSALSYHPYVIESQQSAEMIHALDYVRKHAHNIGAKLSSKLFVTGVSQGGYVALATHKALEAKGETVTASAPISGPYAMGTFMDVIIGQGKVNGGATTFAPMYITALQKSYGIYDDPSEVFSTSTTESMNYADFAENSLPEPGATEALDVGLPETALFSDNFSAPPGHEFGYGSDHLLSDTFRTNYIAAISDPTQMTAASKARALAHAGDLSTGWTPASQITLCGSANDPVVFHVNSNITAASLGSMVTNLNLDGTPSTTPASVVEGIYATVQQKWQSDGVASQVEAIHGSTAFYCAGAALGLFNSLK